MPGPEGPQLVPYGFGDGPGLRTLSAALAAELTAADRGAVGAVYLAGIVRAFRAGVIAALTVERLAELALKLIEVGFGLRRRVIGLTCGIGGLGTAGWVRCSFGAGLLDSHADLLGVRRT